MPLISVIVPVYNVETYLPACLDSLRAQTFADFEALLIDDGSQDTSGEICERYEKEDARFRVIHQPNGGVSVARNTGLDHATGEYIVWVDSDDFIEKNAFEVLYNTITAERAQILGFGYASVWGDSVVLHKGGGERLVYNGRSAVFGALFSRKVVYYLWDKIYKRTLFDGLRFPVGKFAEDAFIIPEVFARADKFVLIPDQFYYYRMRAGSITHMLNNENVREWIDATKPLVDLARREFPEHVTDAQARLDMIRLRCFDTIFECPRFRRHLCWKYIHKEVRGRLFGILFSRSSLIRPARRAYAVCGVFCPDLAAVAVKRKMRKNRKYISYAR